MSKEVEVKGITIKVGARDLSLDVAEAKKLRDALNDLFGKEVVREVHVERWQNPYWYWRGPVWMCGGQAEATWKSPWGRVLCTSSGQLSMEVKS